MAKSVTIKLTDKQQKQLKNLTGESHSEVKFESVSKPRGEMAAKSALGVRHAARSAAPRMAGRLAGRLSARLSTRLATRLSTRLAARTAAKKLV